ncbi:MAG: hypothetical protein ACYC5N_04035 [Endomicrobiales bacterium]
MTTERRRDERLETNMSVKCWIMDRGYNPIMDEHIPANCLNVSAGGMELEWPFWWKCKGCPYSSDEKSGKNACRRGPDCPFEETNRFLVSETYLRVYVDDKKTEQYARVVWIRKKDESCRLGLSFALGEA